ncbi:LOW QUALITY PROTEIN: taste receptor type 2 member 40-like [Onychostruthus taczanowskii]|uniref:LOW QUALITY PROTEIN: taste receptor type 2 member 40-like n=1 Tax=Onychostruthus taczanowskii TaxID=356909 RepID=UPI001B802991|nr:LOW QUALITY PROTEIN: taste receptor type 2 member 40-like [Onychostruthus taczanowskii]
MVTSFALLCLPVGIIESLAGILGDGIILAAISTSCIGSKTWPPYDMIVISLSSSRFILQSGTTLDFLISLSYEPFVYKENVFVVSKTIFTFLSYCSLWFGAWLSVFYCIKVASFTQSFFIWLKLRIARLVPWMLLISWLSSFITAISFAWDVYSVHENITAPSSMTNSSSVRTTGDDSLTLLIYLWNTSTALPLILSVVSSVLLIRSLWIHTRRMQSNASGFRDPSLETHRKVIKSVCSFFIFYITYFICLLLLYSRVFSPLSDKESMCRVILAACPTGHTMVLIWSYPKFQELPARMWHHTKCPVRTISM